MAAGFELSAAQRAVIERAAASRRYREKPVPEELLAQFSDDLWSFVFVPRPQLARLGSVYGAGVDARGALAADWEAALGCGALYLFNEGTVSFALHMELENGSAVAASIAPNNRGDKPWYLTYVPDAARLPIVRADTKGARDADATAFWPASPAASGRPVPEEASGPGFSGAEAAVVPGGPVGPQAPAAPPADASPAVPGAVSQVPPVSSAPELPPLAEREMRALARTASYREHPVPEELLGELPGTVFSETVAIHARVRNRLLELASGQLADAAAVMQLLDRDWAFAREHGLLRYFEDENGGGKKVLFAVSVLREDGATPVELGFWRNRNQGANDAKPWFCYFVADFPLRGSRAVGLFDWAYLGPLDVFLSGLVDLALPERWGYGEDGAGTEILLNYLTYTFHRLQLQQPCGVLENEQAGLAAFNTGLVDATYEPIFAVFSKNERTGAQPWYFQAFAQAGSSANGGWGTRLSSVFSELPPRARYFAHKDDLLFDTERELDINYDHILLENISRLPADFLRDEVPHSARDVLAALDAAYGAQGQEAEERFAELRAMVERDPKIHRRLKNRLEDAIGLTRKRAEWNFRTAVPSYYPTTDTMSLLLPLDLTDDGRTDVALVVELADSGRYLAKTILTMRMAYQDARLVCRPESDWLAPSSL